MTTVENDLYCIGCDYNLRTQSLDAVCPECGLPVQKTMAFPRLSRSKPRWIVSLVDSVTLLLVAFAIDLIQVLLLPQRYDTLSLAAETVPWALVWFAIWLLTRPEPAAERNGMDRTRAWTMRALATAPYGYFAMGLLPLSRNPLLLYSLLLCAGPASFLYFDHLRRDARRLPAPGLAQQAAVLSWLTLLSPVIFVAMIYFRSFRIRWLGGSIPASPRPVLGSAGALPAVWGVITSGSELLHPLILPRLFQALVLVLTVIVLIQFRVAFARAARAAGGASGPTKSAEGHV